MINKLKVALFEESIDILKRDLRELKKLSDIRVSGGDPEEKQEIIEYMSNVQDMLTSNFNYFKIQYNGIDEILSNKINELENDF